MKRLFDIVVSALALAILLPVLMAIVIAIRLDSPGAAFFRQKRVGRRGVIFSILKFRSMVENAESVGGYSTSANDARITRVGRVLRKTSLDELPQLLNVLVGDMSLVGPRPDVPAQRDGYTQEEWELRHSVRPGITGLAQARLRSSATPEERKAMDLYYAENASLWLDLRIILKTAISVLSGSGSN